MSKSANGRPLQRPGTPSVAVIGAGFGGIGLGIKLREAGIDSFTILEKADSVGGIWRDNSYPGLTCDVPSHLYSFSFEPKHDWSRRYPARAEILSYLEHCVQKHRLGDHIRLGTEVAAAEFDQDAAKWRIETVAGETLEADVLVTATGQLSRPHYPDIPGLDSFAGRTFHSARWDHDYDLDGKRVAVVGTGASAIQFVPEIVPRVERLDLYQRSPAWVIPKPDRPFRPREKRIYERFPWVQALSRWRVYWYMELLILAFTKAQWLGKPFTYGYKRRLRKTIPDPQLREKLMPDYPLGCKRLLVTNDWLETLADPKIEVVTDPITEFGSDSVITADGRKRRADALILATGFQATDFLAPMEITGLGGRDLNQEWRDGAEAHLGLAVSGFPNMFMLYGPNTNLGVGSIIFMLESQIHFVLAAIDELRRSGADYIDVRADVQNTFNAEVQRRLADTVWTGGCSSWYQTESGKVTNNWPGFTAEYRRLTRRPDLSQFTLAQA
jgi:cation diffusion facilitator CzcD-associated flavoprotein CzcO